LYQVKKPVVSLSPARSKKAGHSCSLAQAKKMLLAHNGRFMALTLMIKTDLEAD